MTRPILNRWHPGTSKLTYWFPAFFLFGSLVACLLPILWKDPRAWYPLWLLGGYLLLVGMGAGIKSGKPGTVILAPVALLVQFTGYGLGFLKSTILLTFSGKKAEDLFPKLFFKP